MRHSRARSGTSLDQASLQRQIDRLNPVLPVIGADDTAGLVLCDALASMQSDMLLVR